MNSGFGRTFAQRWTVGWPTACGTAILWAVLTAFSAWVDCGSGSLCRGYQSDQQMGLLAMLTLGGAPLVAVVVALLERRRLPWTCAIVGAIVIIAASLVGEVPAHSTLDPVLGSQHAAAWVDRTLVGVISASVSASAWVLLVPPERPRKSRGEGKGTK